MTDETKALTPYRSAAIVKQGVKFGWLALPRPLPPIPAHKCKLPKRPFYRGLFRFFGIDTRSFPFHINDLWRCQDCGRVYQYTNRSSDGIEDCIHGCNSSYSWPTCKWWRNASITEWKTYGGIE